ncbi:uncharacterized protein LOC113364307 [Ctenocephalides felis]|uniref:uncharacterized protein LOC113364307 n=1 Tax=Ctenocephalides felis TaxID=7515 RepID=UPI000E6E5955|nr:uncharacterized protein LOC113364307 [Ctenocephalides felis]
MPPEENNSNPEFFSKETYMYLKVLPEFALLQKELGCKTRFDGYANCIAAGEENLDEFVLMEDLRSQGFLMFDRHQKLDLNHVALVMQELGKYHALSFAMKDQKPELFKKLADFKDVFFDGVLNEGFNTYINTLVDKAQNTLDEDDKCRQKLEQFRHLSTLGTELVKGANAEPYAVINHGDCWNNNVLFRYIEGNSRKPYEVRLLDWQISRYSSPVLDLVYYIFCCTEKQLRKRHYETFLHIYHGSLSSFLHELGSDPEKMFPYRALQDQLKEFGKFGILMSLMVIQAMVMQPEETPDLDEVARIMEEDPENMKFMDPSAASEVIYKSRMRDIIKDMDRLGYIYHSDNKQLSANVLKAVDTFVKSNGYVDHTINITAGSKRGDNYVGIIHKLTLDCTKKDGTKDQRHLICKVPPSNAARREQFKSRECFLREIYTYTKILPEFALLQKELGCKTRFDGFANCIEAGEENLDEFVLMEDLRSQGFLMFDRQQKLDLNHVALVMQELGKYHALSFAMKDQKPESFKKLADLSDVFFDNFVNKQFDFYINSVVDKVVNAMEEGDKCRQKLEKFRDFMTLGKDLAKGANAEPYAVINHGDCWNNNVLFRYIEGKPYEVRLLDWQISRYSSPVLDLVYYIFCCTEKQLRKRHYETFLHIYHGSLSSFLHELGSDPEKMFPYRALQDQLKEFGKFGILMGMTILNAMIANQEDIPDMDEVAEMMKNDPDNKKFLEQAKVNDDKFNRRMIDIIHDMDRLGYI